MQAIISQEEWEEFLSLKKSYKEDLRNAKVDLLETIAKSIPTDKMLMPHDFVAVINQLKSQIRNRKD